MFSSIAKRLITTGSAVFAISLFPAAAFADTIQLSYLPPYVGMELLYRGMGYSDAGGNFVDLAGAHITSASVIVDLTAPDGLDVSSFHMNMAVPVLDANSQFIEVTGNDLIEVSPNHYTYSLTTSDFNGEIYSGGFGVATYGVDADGNPVRMGVTLDHHSGFYFTVDTVSAPVPEPASALMLVGGLALMAPAALRRRKSGVRA